MLLLLVLAMVRPAIRSFIAGRSARNLIVVLDCSPSMLASVKGAAASSASSFLQARGKAVELLSSAGPRDHVAYIEAGAPAKIVSPLTADAARVVDEARRSRISYGGGGGVAQAIVKAAMMLATRKEVLSEVYVLTDMRCNILDGWNERDRAALAEVQQRLGHRLKLHFVDFAPREADNVGIVDVKLAPSRVSAGSGAHLMATIRNMSDSEREVGVQLAVRATSKARRTVVIPARSEAIVDLATPLDSTVNTFCKIELSPPDVLAADNACWVPVRLDPRFEVLIIDGSRPKHAASASAPEAGGKAAGPPTESPMAGGQSLSTVSGAKMLEFALNPAQFAVSEGRGRSRNTVVRRVELSSVNTAMMGTCQLVVLYNVDRLPKQTLDDLYDFVKSGRSVLVIPGDDVNVIEFRSAFVDGPIRLCPATVDNAAPVETGTKVVLGDNLHPAMELFRDPRTGDLGTVRFKRLQRLQPAPGARVIFSVGQMPAAVEMQAVVPGDRPEQARYRGRICVLGFGLEPSWSNLPLTRVFVPLVWRLTDHVAGRLNPLAVDVARAGERAVLDCSDFAPAPSVAVFAPDDNPLLGKDGWPLEVPLSRTDSAVVGGLSAIGPYKVTNPSQVAVEVKLSGAKPASGAISAALLKNVIRNEADSFRLAGNKITRADVAGGDFGAAVTVKGATISLASGSSLTGDVAAGALDEALSGRAGELTVALPGGRRTVAAIAAKGGSFAEALSFGTGSAAGRRVRYIGANLPPRGKRNALDNKARAESIAGRKRMGRCLGKGNEGGRRERLRALVSHRDRSAAGLHHRGHRRPLAELSARREPQGIGRS